MGWTGNAFAYSFRDIVVGAGVGAGPTLEAVSICSRTPSLPITSEVPALWRRWAAPPLSRSSPVVFDR